MYPRKWIRRDPDTDIFHRLLGNERTRPTILFLWDQLFDAEAECYRIEEYYLGEIEKAQKRVADLESRFLKDSHNSSKPPSSDFPEKLKRARSLRESSGLNPGAQPGHPGHALTQVPDPDETRIHPAHTCARCGARLKPLPLLQHEVRQVIDLKNGRKWIIEHRAEMKRCPKCDSINHGGFPPEAKAYVCYGPEVRRIALYLLCYQMLPHARICELFLHLFGLRLQAGSIHRFTVESSKRLKGWENETKKALIQSEVLHADETGVRCEGGSLWLHETGSDSHTLLVPHPKRGSEAMSAIGILPEFKGWVVHDGWVPYFNYQSLSQPHALCNAHHLRELTFVWELEKAPWAMAMKEFLQQSLRHLHRCESLERKIQPRWIRSREKKYDRILRRGYRFYGKTMPKHPVPARAGPQIKREVGHKLLCRLHFYRDEALAFLMHPGVPFTNNLAERDLRMSKVKRKISGCFRSFGGAKAFCRIRSFLSTAIKQGRSPFEELANIFSEDRMQTPT